MISLCSVTMGEKLSITVSFLKEEIKYIMFRAGFMLTVLFGLICLLYEHLVPLGLPLLVSLAILLDVSTFFELRDRVFYDISLPTNVILNKMRTMILGEKFSPFDAASISILGLLTGVLVYDQPQPGSKLLGISLICLIIIAIPYMMKQLQKYKIGIIPIENPKEVLDIWLTRLQRVTAAIETIYLLSSVFLVIFVDYWFFLVAASSCLYFVVVIVVRKIIIGNISELLEAADQGGLTAK